MPHGSGAYAYNGQETMIIMPGITNQIKIQKTTQRRYKKDTVLEFFAFLPDLFL